MSRETVNGIEKLENIVNNLVFVSALAHPGEKVYVRVCDIAGEGDRLVRP